MSVHLSTFLFILLPRMLLDVLLQRAFLRHGAVTLDKDEESWLAKPKLLTLRNKFDYS